MKTFGWFCFCLGITILIVGLPIAIIYSPTLIGKVLLAVGVNTGIGWKLAHPKVKTTAFCPYCGINIITTYKFCNNCGVQLKR